LKNENSFWSGEELSKKNIPKPDKVSGQNKQISARKKKRENCRKMKVSSETLIETIWLEPRNRFNYLANRTLSFRAIQSVKCGAGKSLEND
jgi:hypothetical protein